MLSATEISPADRKIGFPHLSVRVLATLDRAASHAAGVTPLRDLLAANNPEKPIIIDMGENTSSDESPFSLSIGIYAPTFKKTDPRAMLSVGKGKPIIPAYSTFGHEVVSIRDNQNETEITVGFHPAGYFDPDEGRRLGFIDETGVVDEQGFQSFMASLRDSPVRGMIADESLVTPDLILKFPLEKSQALSVFRELRTIRKENPDYYLFSSGKKTADSTLHHAQDIIPTDDKKQLKQSLPMNCSAFAQRLMEAGGVKPPPHWFDRFILAPSSTILRFTNSGNMRQVLRPQRST